MIETGRVPGDERSRGWSLRAEIEPGRCQGHGRCAVICPEVFDLDEAGVGMVILQDVPTDLRERVQQAVLNCPERAITLTKEELP